MISQETKFMLGGWKHKNCHCFLSSRVVPFCLLVDLT